MFQTRGKPITSEQRHKASEGMGFALFDMAIVTKSHLGPRPPWTDFKKENSQIFLL